MRKNLDRAILWVLIVVLVAFAWRNGGWESSLCLGVTILVLLGLERRIGKKNASSLLAGAASFLLGVALLSSVFTDIMTTLTISAGFMLISISANFFLDVFGERLKRRLKNNEKAITPQNEGKSDQSPPKNHGGNRKNE